MRIRCFFFSFVALVLFGCIREAEPSTSKERQITIRAYHEGADLTRTTVQDGGTQVFWEPKDDILVFYKDAHTVLNSKNTEVVPVTEFSGGSSFFQEVLEGGIDPNYMIWGLYPYKENATSDGKSVTTTLPSNQMGRPGSFAKNTHITLAQSTDLNLAFYNVCGGVRFSFTQEGIKRVVFEGNNGESIAGRIKISFAGGVPIIEDVSAEKTKITLTASNGETFHIGQWYYIEAIPGSLKDGFKLTLYKDSECAEYTSSNSVTIKRAVYGSLRDVDKNLEFNSFSHQEYPIPEAIDLGLGVKWASFNLGASKPEDVGFYFAWGETEPKEYYDWSTYKWCNGDIYSLTKYNTSKSFGAIDDRKILDIEDDAAHTNLGGNWLMPTKEDLDELAKHCLIEKTILDGVQGYKVTSRIDGYTDSYIFFPAAGRYFEDSLEFKGDRCAYWCSSQYGGSGLLASYSFRADYFGAPGNVQGSNRYHGFSIRPVQIGTMITEIALSEPTTPLWPGREGRMGVIVFPENASRKSLTWTSSDKAIATVDEAGNITAIAAGKTIITASAIDGSGISSTCEITIADMPVPEAVDLGLSVKWASFNLGAAYDHNPGSYFAWGEIMPKTIYSWSTYKWCQGGESTLTKYNTDASYGIIDNKTTLDLEDDAAHVHLGGTWRIPTLSEIQELYDNCKLSGHWTGSGVRFTSKKEGYTDASIYLPSIADYPVSNIQGASRALLYWSSSVDVNRPSVAMSMMYPLNDYHSYYSVYRYNGFCIRPVCE